MTIPISAIAAQGAGDPGVSRAGGGEWSVGSLQGPQPGAPKGSGNDEVGFGSMLDHAVGALQHTQDVAAAQSQALATGQTQDISSVVTAVQEASLSMQLAAQIRDKAVEAYTEIFRTQI